MKPIEKLALALKSSPGVVFTGAGVSTNSGIPDFRSETGFYNKYHEDDLAIEAYFNNPDKFYNAFWEKFSNVFDAKPNDTHKILAELEQLGLLKGIITQNVDRLHQKGGSKNVIEFHGNIFDYNMIQITNKSKHLYRIIQSDVPIQSLLNGNQIDYRNGNYLYKPQVVLYGEGITKWSESVSLSNAVKTHIIIGTSYVVSPFNMISYDNKYEDLQVFIINNEPIEYHGRATQIIGDCSKILRELMTYIK